MGIAGVVLDDECRGFEGDVVEIEFEAGTRGSDGLMPAIEAVRDRLGVDAGGLSRVCVSVGPGGYTGLRVSVTVAKSIAAATGASLAAVPSAAVALGDAPTGDPGIGGVIVCLASKGEATHATVFGPGTGPMGTPVGVVRAADIAGLIGSTLIGDGFLPASIREACDACGKRIEPPRFSAARCLRLGMGLEPVDPASLVPVYAREPEAVRLWRERHGADA